MIHILGAGAMGCLWAAQLSHSQPVRFISQRDAEQQAISFTLHQRFLTPPSPAQCPEQRYEIDVCNLNSTMQIDTLLVCTKSYDTLPALQSIATKIGAKTKLILFQNGLGCHYRVLDQFPDHPVFAAVTTEGVNRPAPQTVNHAGQGQTMFGALNAHASDSSILEQSYQSLANSGLTVHLKTDIWQALWKKLAINCAINPFTALLDCANGELLAQPLFNQLWPELKLELTSMLTVAGYPTEVSELEQLIFKVMNQTQLNISSMLQDVRHHRPTEIDDINGFACRYCQSKGLAHQINKQLWEQVSALGN